MGGTTNIELIELSKKYKLDLIGVYEKDTIPKKVVQGWYIINMQNHNQGNGSHWVCFKYSNDSVYIDSFGVVPPIEIINALHGRFIYNRMQIQDYENEDCGLFCICAMLFWSQFKMSSNAKILDAYNKLFVNKPKVNTIIMKNFLKNNSEKHGGAISAGHLKTFISDSYNQPNKDIGDYQLDKSTEFGNTYYNPKTNHAVIVHRGTKGAKDWLNNLAYATGTYNLTDRYKSGKNLQKYIESKYGKENVSIVGHSQGSVLSRKLGQNSKEIINLNPAWLGEPQTNKEFIVRSANDPVSGLLAPVNRLKSWLYPKQTASNNISVPSLSYDPLKEHSVDVLDRLDKHMMIGNGIKNKKRQRSNWVHSKIII